MKKIISSILIVCLLLSVSLAVEGTNKTIKVDKVVRDEILESGEVDYFNFSIPTSGSIQIRFEFDVEGEYSVKLINSDTEKEVQRTTFNSKVNTSDGRCEKLANKIRLEGGDYQIQVSSGYWTTCKEEYELEVLYIKEKGDSYEKEANNDARTAMIIDYNSRVTGNLESEYDVDYYMAEIPYNGELYTELSFDREAKYNVEVFADNNGTLKSLQNKKYEAKLNQKTEQYFDTSEKLRVPAGNYYFKISKTWYEYSNEDYVFCVRFLKNMDRRYEFENNNEPKNANEIIPDNEIIGNMNSSQDVDYYRVNMWNYNKMTISMNVPENASYTVTTYKNVNGELSRVNSETFKNKDLIGLINGKEQEISTGEYYFKVSSNSYSNKDYTFVVSTRSYTKSTIELKINDPYMIVNGISYPIDGDRGTAPVIVNNRTLLPIRAVIESLGGKVTWNDSVRGIYIELGNKNVYLTLDSTLSYVNGEAKYLDVAPTAINGRTMVPVKFVMDNLGASVIWNGTTGTVTITY